MDMETTTMTLFPKDLKEGDVTAGGSTIRGPLWLVKGGTLYAVTRPDGTDGTLVFDNRRKYTITRGTA